MEKMEDWWGNLEKLEKLDDELSERLFGNYNLLKMKMVFNVSIFARSFWINDDFCTSSLFAQVLRAAHSYITRSVR